MTLETESQTPKTLKMVESDVKMALVGSRYEAWHFDWITKILEFSFVGNFSQNVRHLVIISYFYWFLLMSKFFEGNYSKSL